MAWYFAVAERDHEIQNPTTPAKIRLLGEYLRLGPATHVLDVAAGKCGPAVIFAADFGCRITAIERAPEFVAAARDRIAAAGVGGRVELVEADAAEVDLGGGRYDVAMCLGASFVWAGLEGTITALTPTVRAGGAVVVGEPYWRRLPLPDGVDSQGFVPLAGTVGRFVAAGLTLETLTASSEDDWDRYESLHWRALEEYLAEHDDPELRARYEHDREQYLHSWRGLMGWAIFIGRRT